MMSLLRGRRLLPDLVLHQLCDYLNLDEVKSFRLVCMHWYFVARTHIQNKTYLKINTLRHQQFKDFANTLNDTGGYYPIRDLKLSINPRSVGCKCELCPTSNYYGKIKNQFGNTFNESTLDNIIRKFSSGINSFDIVIRKCHQNRIRRNRLGHRGWFRRRRFGMGFFGYGAGLRRPWVTLGARDRIRFFDRMFRRNGQRRSMYGRMPSVFHMKINVERLLLREEFRCLRDLRIHDPFKFTVTQDSEIRNVFRNLTALQLSPTCGNKPFADNLFQACHFLKCLTIQWNDPNKYYRNFYPYYHHFEQSNMITGTVKILDALRVAKNQNGHLAVEELKIECEDCIQPSSADAAYARIFAKIDQMNLKLRVLHVSILMQYTSPVLMLRIEQLLNSQKDYLESLSLPKFWRTSPVEVQNFPQMRNLKELETSVSFNLPERELRDKIPALKTLKINFELDTKANRYWYKHPYVRATEFLNQLRQNILPCTSVSELNLGYIRDVKMLNDFSQLFPNVKYLNIILKLEDLQNIWTIWPRLTELDLTVESYNLSKINRWSFTDNSNGSLLVSKFHAGLIGMPVNECEALLESSVPFLPLKAENYNYNLPSIRDLTELKKLTLNCGLTCNLALMLGILPLKRLMEVNIAECNMTIECVQHILKHLPDIKRWDINGICVPMIHHDHYIMQYYHYDWNGVGVPHIVRRYVSRPRADESISWKISSGNDNKYSAGYHFPTSTSQRFRAQVYKLHLRSVNNYGRGNCLYWTPYHCSPSPYVYR